MLLELSVAIDLKFKNMYKNMSFQKSFYYFCIALISITVGRLIFSKILNINFNINLYLSFCGISILSYFLSYKIITIKFRDFNTYNFLTKMLPLFIVIGITLGFLLNLVFKLI